MFTFNFLIGGYWLHRQTICCVLFYNVRVKVWLYFIQIKMEGRKSKTYILLFLYI